jgi:hypothetical protein
MFPAVAHTKETEVDHMRFNASYKAMQVGGGSK